MLVGKNAVRIKCIYFFLYYIIHNNFISLCSGYGWMNSVLAYVEGKMVKPPPERPQEGIITIHSELSPMASSEYEIGR